MPALKPMIERAYELARTGNFTTVTGVKMALKREGYVGVEPVFVGGSFRTQIRALIKSANASRLS